MRKLFYTRIHLYSLKLSWVTDVVTDGAGISTARKKNMQVSHHVGRPGQAFTSWGVDELLSPVAIVQPLSVGLHVGAFSL